MSAPSLFNNELPISQNLLPVDGEAFYFGRIFTPIKADEFLNLLANKIQWKNDQSFIYGKLITTKRKVAWYGDEPYSYTYSKIERKALPWTDELLLLKQAAESVTNESYNSCLLNLYHNGEEGMGWHSDNEKELQTHAAIASLSFGAERKFMFRHNETKETVSVKLEHGSLLLMKGTTQSNWKHRLPPARTVQQPRINLTFRTMA